MSGTPKPIPPGSIVTKTTTDRGVYTVHFPGEDEPSWPDWVTTMAETYVDFVVATEDVVLVGASPTEMDITPFVHSQVLLFKRVEGVVDTRVRPQLQVTFDCQNGRLGPLTRLEEVCNAAQRHIDGTNEYATIEDFWAGILDRAIKKK